MLSGTFPIAVRARTAGGPVACPRCGGLTGQVHRCYQRTVADVPADGRPVVVHVGRIAHEKNIDFLMRMMVPLREQIPDALLLVAGEGPALAHCRRLAAELGLENHTLFVGYLDRQQDLLDCYRAGDAFVFASRTETQGLVLLEAMAQGTPVVSTAELGTRSILVPGSGALVVPEEATAFAAAVVRVLADPGLREGLAARGRAYARTWSSATMAQRLAALYGQLCATSRAAHVTA